MNYWSHETSPLPQSPWICSRCKLRIADCIEHGGYWPVPVTRDDLLVRIAAAGIGVDDGLMFASATARDGYLGIDRSAYMEGTSTTELREEIDFRIGQMTTAEVIQLRDGLRHMREAKLHETDKKLDEANQTPFERDRARIGSVPGRPGGTIGGGLIAGAQAGTGTWVGGSARHLLEMKIKEHYERAEGLQRLLSLLPADLDRISPEANYALARILNESTIR